MSARAAEASPYQTLAEGFVVHGLGACSRVVVTDGGDLLCTYVLRTGAGVPDYTPHQSRSDDGGRTWTAEGPVWPSLVGRASISVALSRSRAGDALPLRDVHARRRRRGQLVGRRAAGAQAERPDLGAIIAMRGRTWPDPTIIPMPIPGAAEAPGPMTVTRSGRLVAVYAPYNTFDESVEVDRNQIVLVKSDDDGQTWSHTSMLRFADPESGGAESWVVELADGRLVGAAWHMSLTTGRDERIPYGISHDGGDTWTPTRSTGIVGQATSLAALPDGRVLLVYNQREQPDPGVWLAVADPSDDDFGVQRLGPAWLAERATINPDDSGHDAWQDFRFGEPSVTLLPDGDVLVTLWCDQPSGPASARSGSRARPSTAASASQRPRTAWRAIRRRSSSRVRFRGTTARS